MNSEEKNKLILDFINGPLREYLLEDKISFGRFKERINEICGTDFCYSDIYPSYLFNAQLTYKEADIFNRSDLGEAERKYEERLKECHAYGLCASGIPYDFPCYTCPCAGKK